MIQKINLLKNSRFLDFSPLKRYNRSTSAPVAQWIERLTSNWTEMVNILSMEGTLYIRAEIYTKR